MVIDLTLTSMECKLYSRQMDQRMHDDSADQECDYCGSAFSAESFYRYCGTVMGCKQDEFGETVREMARLYPEFHEESTYGQFPT